MTNPTDDDDVSKALAFYLRSNKRTGDETADLVAAIKRSMQLRVDNSHHGGVVIAALYARLQSWRTVSSLTGMPVRTLRRWAESPRGADAASGDQEQE